MNVPPILRKVQPAVIECRLIAAVNAIVHSTSKTAILESVGRTSGPSHFCRRTTSLGPDTSSTPRPVGPSHVRIRHGRIDHPSPPVMIHCEYIITG